MFGCSGYDIHFRQLANALSKLTEVRVTTNAVPGWERMVTDRELEMIKRPPEKDEINLIITSPTHWKLNTYAKRNWAYLVWEGDKIPKSWIEECLNPNIEYILVPSMHTFEAIMRTPKESDSREEPSKTLGEKIKIIPHGVDLNLFYPKEKPKDKTIFIANKGFRNPEDRGGIQYLIRAYIEEFTDKDKVELKLKINPAYGIPDIGRALAQISPRKDRIPKIIVNTEALKYEQLVKIYNQGHVFVSPTRSDAFNIPCIEAMACGLPVITTNFGGQTDYVNKENGWIITGKLEEVKHELTYEGIKWLTPSIPELRKCMREAYNKPQSILKKGKKALETARKYTWEESAKKIINLF